MNSNTAFNVLGKLTDDDFPTGGKAPLNHPKIEYLIKLVEDLADEYQEADKITEEREHLRSRANILTLVVSLVRPVAGQGSYKKRKKSSTSSRQWIWVLDRDYSDSKLRTRLSNRFSKLLRDRAAANTTRALTQNELADVCPRRKGIDTQGANNAETPQPGQLLREAKMPDLHKHSVAHNDQSEKDVSTAVGDKLPIKKKHETRAVSMLSRLLADRSGARIQALNGFKVSDDPKPTDDETFQAEAKGRQLLPCKRTDRSLISPVQDYSKEFNMQGSSTAGTKSKVSEASSFENISRESDTSLIDWLMSELSRSAGDDRYSSSSGTGSVPSWIRQICAAECSLNGLLATEQDSSMSGLFASGIDTDMSWSLFGSDRDEDQSSIDQHAASHNSMPPPVGLNLTRALWQDVSLQGDHGGALSANTIDDISFMDRISLALGSFSLDSRTAISSLSDEQWTILKGIVVPILRLRGGGIRLEDKLLARMDPPKTSKPAFRMEIHDKALPNMEITVRLGDAKSTKPSRTQGKSVAAILGSINYSNDTSTIILCLEDLVEVLVNGEDFYVDHKTAFSIFDTIKDVLQQHVGHNVVLLRAFCVLGSMYDIINDQPPPVVIVDAVITALERHRWNVLLEQASADANLTMAAGCEALGHLAWYHRETQGVIADSGGIKIVMKVMTENPNDCRIQAICSTTLDLLAFEHTSNQTQISDAGGVTALMAGMETHLNNAEIQVNVFNALANLACSHSHNRALIVAAPYHGCEVIKNAMKHHIDDSEVQGTGFWALGVLSNKYGNHSLDRRLSPWY